MMDIDSVVDSELDHNDNLRDLYPDEDERIAKDEWFKYTGYIPKEYIEYDF